MTKVFLPPSIVPVQDRLLFLAGPIQGTSDWQSEAITLIKGLDKDIAIANPRREYLGDSFMYAKQVDWETHFLRLAAQRGGIIFWLARERDHDPARAYAQTTRFELAEWKEKHMRDGVKLFIGIEEGYSGARYVRHRFAQDCPETIIYDSLAETCRAAVRGI